MSQETEKKIVIVSVWESPISIINGDRAIERFQYDMNDPQESLTTQAEIVDLLLKEKTLILVPQF